MMRARHATLVYTCVLALGCCTVPGGTSAYTGVLFSNWEQVYDRIMAELLTGPLALDSIRAEIDRAVSLSGAILDSDPALASGSSDGERLHQWWDVQHPSVQAKVAEH